MKFYRVIRPTVSEVFSAGALGGFANGIVVWGFGALGLTKALGVFIAPEISPGFLYPRIVWGGLWGVLFLLPLLRKSVILKGILYSMGPTLVQLFIIFPYKADKGQMGLELGMLTPLFVVVFNAVWGITAAVWLQFVARR